MSPSILESVLTKLEWARVSDRLGVTDPMTEAMHLAALLVKDLEAIQ